MVFKQLVFATIIISMFMIGIFNLLADVEQNYDTDFNAGDIDVTTEFNNATVQADALREQLSVNQSLSGLDSVAAFFQASFISTRLLYDMIPTMASLMTTGFSILGIDSIVFVALLSLVGFLVTLGIIKLISGRVID